MVLPLFDSFGESAPFALNSDSLIATRRRAKLGGWLIFVFNLALEPAEAKVTPQWDVTEAEDLLAKKSVEFSDGSFAISVESGGGKVIYC